MTSIYLWMLRAAATLLLFAGFAILAASLATAAMPSDWPVLRTVGSALLQMGLIFLGGGAIALYVSARPSARDVQAPWRAAMAVTLVALPTWMLLRLRPFFGEWRRVIDALDTPGFWDGANSNFSGVILLPLFGALTPPFIELVAATAIVVASAVLIVMLFARSPRFAHAYVVTFVLLATLVIAGARGAFAARITAEAVQQLSEDPNAPSEEKRQIGEALTRYITTVGDAAGILLWTLGAYAVWLPLVIGGRRETEAPRAISPPAAWPPARDATSPQRRAQEK